MKEHSIMIAANASGSAKANALAMPKHDTKRTKRALTFSNTKPLLSLSNVNAKLLLFVTSKLSIEN